MARFLNTFIVVGMLFVCGCAPEKSSQTLEAVPDSNSTLIPASANLGESTTTPTSIPQSYSPEIKWGSNLEDFPPYINPLTGLPVANSTLLDLPALLVSITHFPPQVRPQAGLSFAPWVFDYLIANGSNRFLAVFYGEYPHAEEPFSGPCEVRTSPFISENGILGNRVWYDRDQDGIQEPGEPGVGGICVDLLDGTTGEISQHTSTDSNGFYGFNVAFGEELLLEFDSGDYKFTRSNFGFEDLDSDVDPTTRRTEKTKILVDFLDMDAGVYLPIQSGEAPTHQLLSGVVGPVRSARLVNIHIQNFFQDSCLIYAGSTREIRDRIPGCAEVFQTGEGGAGGLLDVERMVRIAEDHARKSSGDFRYASNLFETRVPANGVQVSRLDLYTAELNQAAWVYDPSLQAWLRYVDSADKQKIGILHPDTDRLNGRQLFFENLIVLFADHEVLAPAIIDMALQQGESDKALLFRDGRMYEIKWSTRAGEYEQTTGLRRPIQFLDQQGNPFPLHPGRTWIMIATPYSQIDSTAPEMFTLRIVAPPGAGDY
jgi:hypothetical protein